MPFAISEDQKIVVFAEVKDSNGFFQFDSRIFPSVARMSFAEVDEIHSGTFRIRNILVEETVYAVSKIRFMDIAIEGVFPFVSVYEKIDGLCWEKEMGIIGRSLFLSFAKAMEIRFSDRTIQILDAMPSRYTKKQDLISDADGWYTPLFYNDENFDTENNGDIIYARIATADEGFGCIPMALEKSGCVSVFGTVYDAALFRHSEKMEASVGLEILKEYDVLLDFKGNCIWYQKNEN